MDIPNAAEANEFINSELDSGYDDRTDKWELIVKYNGELEKLERDLDIGIEILNENYAIITIEREQIPRLADYKEIEYIEKPRNLTINADDALSRSCIPPVQRPSGFGLTGNGTIVAIIDSGIDYTHPEFRNEDGTSRILYLWDQGGANSNSGTEYSKEQLDAALKSPQPFELVPENDFVGHGTAVAGIACGKSGVAPESSIIVVKLKSNPGNVTTRSTEIMRALKYVTTKAEALNMPVAINISYGTNHGSHDGSSLFEDYIDDVAQEWKTIIAVAAGNEGVAAHHYAGTIASNETQDIEFFTSGDLNNFFISLWKNFVDAFSIELLLPSGASTGALSFTDRHRLINLGEVAIYVDFAQPTPFSKTQEVFIQLEAQSDTLPQGVWKLRIKAATIVDGRFDIWLPVTERVSDKTAFTKPSIETTITIPATARNVISVGGYDSRLNTLADFSGRGFTVVDIYAKPDLVAPAVAVTSAQTGGGYDSFTGTSFAAPFVTGSAALMMQWGIVEGNDQFLYGQRVKAFLETGAERKDNIVYPNGAWGYGSLCLKRTMDALVKNEPPSRSPAIQSVFAQRSAYTDVPLSEYIKQPNIVGFTVLYNDNFRRYAAEHPELRLGTMLSGGYAVAYAPQERLYNIIVELGGEYINMFTTLFGLMGKESLDAAGITRVQQQTYLYLRGSGVLIGFIDTGIDYTKPAFLYEDGTSKIKYLWDQTIEGTAPENMHFGAEYTQDMINEALKSDDPYSIVPSRDTVGHGTFLASVAAGRENNEYIGAAPDSEIVVVKLKRAGSYYLQHYQLDDQTENVFESTDILLGFRYIAEKAQELSRPIVFCIGVGSNFGRHDGSTFMEKYFAQVVTSKGSVICTAAGNESNAKHHAEGTIEKTGDKQIIGVRVPENVKYFMISIWSALFDKLAVGVKSPTGEVIDKVPLLAGYGYTKKLVLEKTVVSVEYYKDNGWLCLVRFTDPTPGIWEVTVFGDNVISGRYHAYLPITGLTGSNVEFLTPSPNYTVVIPGTGTGTLTCGAYDDKSNSLYASSSWGPTTAQFTAPDFVAPGVNVTGVYPTGYGTMTGTSVASAITAGACALLLQWGIVEKQDYDMNSDTIRALLIRGCDRDENVKYPNDQTGYGRINLIETFNKIRVM